MTLDDWRKLKPGDLVHFTDIPERKYEILRENPEISYGEEYLVYDACQGSHRIVVYLRNHERFTFFPNTEIGKLLYDS